MITMDALIMSGRGLERAEVEHWVEQDWVRPDRSQGTWLFRDIDIARLHLIRDLRRDLGLQEEVIPMVLGLLDQLYGERRRLRRMKDIVQRIAPVEMREALLEAMRCEVVYATRDE